MEGAMKQLVLLCALASACVAADLTGNWLVETPNGDGTMRRVYFNLKQEGGRITGTVRATQFFYSITQSSGGAENFTFTASMRDSEGERHVSYKGKLDGDELQIVQVRANGLRANHDCAPRTGRRGRAA